MFKSESEALFDYIKELIDEGRLKKITEPSSYWIHGNGNSYNTRPFESYVASLINGYLNPEWNDSYKNLVHGDIYLKIITQYCTYHYDIDIKVSENMKFVGSISSNSLCMYRGWYFLFTDDRHRLLVLSAYDLYLHLINTEQFRFLVDGIGDFDLKNLLSSGKIRYKEFNI